MRRSNALAAERGLMNRANGVPSRFRSRVNELTTDASKTTNQ